MMSAPHRPMPSAMSFAMPPAAHAQAGAHPGGILSVALFERLQIIGHGLDVCVLFLRIRGICRGRRWRLYGNGGCWQHQQYHCREDEQEKTVYVIGG